MDSAVVEAVHYPARVPFGTGRLGIARTGVIPSENPMSHAAGILPLGMVKGTLPAPPASRSARTPAPTAGVPIQVSLDEVDPYPAAQTLGDASPACRLWPRVVFANAGQYNRLTVGEFGHKR